MIDYHSMGKHIKLKCIESNTMNDFIFLPHGLIFGSSVIPRNPSDDDITHTILVAGKDYTLSVYTIGGKMKFQHLGKLAEFVKDSLETAVSNTFVSIFGGLVSSSNKDSGKNSNKSNNTKTSTNTNTNTVNNKNNETSI